MHVISIKYDYQTNLQTMITQGHIKLVHEKLVKFECEKCIFTADTKKLLKKHTAIVHNKK